MRKTTMPGLGFLGREELWVSSKFLEGFSKGFFPMGFLRINSQFPEGFPTVFQGFSKGFFQGFSKDHVTGFSLIRHFVGLVSAVGTGKINHGGGWVFSTREGSLGKKSSIAGPTLVLMLDFWSQKNGGLERFTAR